MNRSVCFAFVCAFVCFGIACASEQTVSPTEQSITGDAPAAIEPQQKAEEPRPTTTVQTWDVDPALGVAIAASVELFPTVKIKKYRVMSPVVTSKSSCRATVHVPPYPAEASHPDSEIRCQLQHEDGVVSEVRLPLADTGISVWGNRPSRNHREENGLPPIFQIEDQSMGLALFAALKYQHGKMPQIDDMLMCSPDGRQCTEEYSLQHPTATAYTAYLVCHRNVEDGATYKSRCIFFYPEVEPRAASSSL